MFFCESGPAETGPLWEQPENSTGVDKDNIPATLKAPGGDFSQHTGKCLARVNRVEHQAFQPTQLRYQCKDFL